MSETRPPEITTMERTLSDGTIIYQSEEPAGHFCDILWPNGDRGCAYGETRAQAYERAREDRHAPRGESRYRD